MSRIGDWLIARALRRAPDFQIGGAVNPYCNRWWIIPRNRVFNIYLHQFVRDDDDRALHDHPWLNCSIPLRGGYVEVRFERTPRRDNPLPLYQKKVRLPGSVTLRLPSSAHRVVLFRKDGESIEAWSLFLTGPTLRAWGFWCPTGGQRETLASEFFGSARWVHWRDFTAGPNGEIVGKGCEE